MSKQYHPFHLVDPSPWPYLGGLSALMLTLGAVLYFHYSLISLLLLGLITLATIMTLWWRDVMSEATFQGHHTQMVQEGLKMGVMLFIVSEVCFFVSFFWAFFHSSLSPAIQMGAMWPPAGMEILNPFSVPLLNTAILLSSGATVTWAHHAILSSKRTDAMLGLSMTVLLGILFTALQALEYYEAPFAIADSVYGSTFFVATGFHGFHVMIGTSFLLVCLGRLILHHFTKSHHLGFEAASWYWHFVDVVWLFLYICMYWWGS